MSGRNLKFRLRPKTERQVQKAMKKVDKKKSAGKEGLAIPIARMIKRSSAKQ